MQMRGFCANILELANGIPSHDTIQRVMAAIEPKYMQGIVLEWKEIINGNEGEKLKKIINIDGKTMLGNASAKAKDRDCEEDCIKISGLCACSKR